MRPMLLLLFIFAIIGLQSCGPSQADVLRQQQLANDFSKAIEQQDSLQRSAQEHMRHLSIKRPHLKPIYEAALTVPLKTDSLYQLLVSLKNEASIDQSQIQQLEDLITSTRQQLLQIIDDIHAYNEKAEMAGIKFTEKWMNKLKEDLVLGEDVEINSAQLLKNTTKLEAELILQKIELQAKISEQQITNFLSANMGYRTLCGYGHGPWVFSSSLKPYIMLGESYQSTIALGGFSNESEIAVQVDTQQLTVEDNRASYHETPTTVGTHSYTVQAKAKNLYNGKITELAPKTFYYEVVPKAAAFIQKDNQSYLYKGWPNIFRLESTYPAEDLEILAPNGIKINRQSSSDFQVTVDPSQPSDFMTVVKIKHQPSQKIVGIYYYKVFPTPEPTVTLSNNKSDGYVTAREMRAQRGLMADIINRDVSSQSQIQEFVLHYIPTNGTVESHTNQGGTFQGKVKELAQSAKAGDHFIFTDIKVRCPGDSQGRQTYSLSFIVQ